MKNISKTYTKLRSAHACLLGAGALMLGISLGVSSPRLRSKPEFRSTSLFSLPASALELGDGRTFFERSPRLIRSATSFRGRVARAYYYFTIEVPEDAGEPLKAVTILQHTNVEQIVFFPSQTRAFFGDSFKEDSSIALASVNRESSEKNGVKVVFEKPVQPGNVVTISLRARNPRYGGIYQFGVTAFPVGENSQGLYLGAGRIHFSQRT